jgi:transcriptional regulator with XRE-family HTH domain
LAKKTSLEDLLHDTRVRKGLSVQELSSQIGVTINTVYAWETGRSRPRENNLKALCRVLKLPIRSTLELIA